MTQYDTGRIPKQFILCFDGTGNKFQGNESDSNVLKIFRMLDRSDCNQCHYYQPGIGTYVTSQSLSSKGRLQKVKSAYLKAKDAAVGSTFADHVMGGYKFLMRYYSPGDELYFFGFSRGAYVARFLAEMLDFVGLLEMGNEELVRFAWKTFAKWQQRRSDSKSYEKEKEEHFKYMMAFRETFSRPVTQIQFLGLFDTVNSVPRFENPWLQRSKFPYTARTSARVIRHAVGIDERRAKFRQDLVSEVKPRVVSRHSRLRQHLQRHGLHVHHHGQSGDPTDAKQATDEAPGDTAQQKPGPNYSIYRPARPAPGQWRADGPGHVRERRQSPARPQQERSYSDASNISAAAASESCASVATSTHLGGDNATGWDEEDEDLPQDIEEVWFPGAHADIGGAGSSETARNGPGAMSSREEPGSNDRTERKDSKCQVVTDPQFCEALCRSSTDGRLHDCLKLGNGLPPSSVLSWKLMEWMPFRRMDLQSDGAWKPIRWPLPRGEVRDMPPDAQVHVSAIRRLQANPDYRPGNLIIGGGGTRRTKGPEGVRHWNVG
ncbi:hypothetical protein N7532_009805 [Penicillium argentinense]|uniref:T6SS Phospholipase effector Tle1-like catalytic domain-containing protein n=1 Tax=Penicillium argentinense TaxID=1131581 RepID=A0A9W9JX18_9EURO|nr:uncharacterized protein N7532_009805 [Penicillium argentinense]KAJ5085034.1 hypothetical protein N7532_009805 [Penicillium argentinense]